MIIQVARSNGTSPSEQEAEAGERVRGADVRRT